MVGDTRHIAWRRALAAACLLLAPVAVTESPDHPHYRGLRFPCLPHLGSAPQDLDYSFNRRGDYGGTTSVRTTKASPVKRPVKMLSQLGEDAVLVQHFFHGPRWACQDGPCPYTYLELGANNGVSMYPHKKLDCTRPMDLAPQPLRAARGTPATLMMTRSALHNNRANAIRPTTTKL